ncbi:MAG: hypothetical protein Q9157_008364 [Trypethelium eluteriae]
MDVSGLDDMLLDESSMEGSSQESLTGRFEDLFASHNKGFLPIVDPLPSADESLAITVVFRILEMVHDALVNNILITKRDIYYHDPNLFTKQEIVDRYVDDIAYTFEVPRSLLNVRATAKGLVAGRFELHKRDGSIIAGSTEKESEQGKGYPDIATRAFLRALVVPSTWNLFSSPKSYALVDYDPDGLAILSTYKHGSRALPHENMDIAIGTIEWLGLNSSQAIADREVVDYQQGLVTLSDRDRRRANQLLDDAPFREAGPERAWRRELQVMLVLNMKAEMQICDSDVKGLSRWLEVHLS